jgi:hypothetical protein
MAKHTRVDVVLEAMHEQISNGRDIHGHTHGRVHQHVHVHLQCVVHVTTRTQSLRRRRPRVAVLDFSCRAQGTDCNDCRLPSAPNYVAPFFHVAGLFMKRERECG